MTNEIILASAGSGKTYQLTNRYIAIMAQEHLAGKEPRPDQIIAITFTRKAAGEFFDEILKKLALGSQSTEQARKIAGSANDPENPFHETLVQLSSIDYQALLSCFINKMSGLHLGTLDSFFSQIVKAFPAEFGLAGEFEIIDEYSAQIARNEVLRKVFQQCVTQPETSEFLEAFRLATFGSEEPSIQSLLDRFIENTHHILLSASSPKLWGNPKAIWPAGSSWLEVSGDLRSDFKSLIKLFEGENLKDSQWKYWHEFEDQLPSYHAGTPLPPRIDFLLKKFLENWDTLLAGEASFKVNRAAQEFTPEACALIVNITRHFIGDEIKTKLVRTHGLWLILSEYERHYAQLVRQRGRLTFHDLEIILAGAKDSPAPVLTQAPDADARMRIDYRLDSSYRHWLLDEFQDTSFLQWSIIANLIDEAIQDDSAERSFFQVGDTKQAIYAWRGGDTRLFDDIHRTYSDIGPRSLQSRHLDVSWRSGHDVIEPLNQIFGHPEAFRSLGLSEETIARWKWQRHRIAKPNEERPGITAYYQPLADEGEKATQEDCYALTLALLEEIQPLEKGLSCALLVQSNREGRALVDYIRLHSPSKIPVISESDVAIAIDNPVTQAFLALFRLAAHPHDSFTAKHLELSPLIELCLNKQRTFSELGQIVRAQIHEQGFEATLQFWIQEADHAKLIPDLFSRSRLNELTLAARLFDASTSTSIDEFLAYAESYQLREPNAQTAVQVMTIHKSKGLTFDVVLLPQLDGNTLTIPRNQIAVQRDRESREIEWVLDPPRKNIMEIDPVLKEHYNQNAAEAGYEQLCKFYVALTRARYANYLIAIPRAKRSTKQNFVQLLDETLENDNEGPEEELRGVKYRVAYQSDLPTTRNDWWNHLPEKDSSQEDAPEKEQASRKPQLPTPAMNPRIRPPRQTPSRHFTQASLRKPDFTRADHHARELGILVHEMLQKIEWWHEGLVLPESSHQLSLEATYQVQQVLTDPLCQEALCLPDLEKGQSAKLWREQSFEVLIDGRWTSGVIDRATIILDAEGAPLSAHILDYKTDYLSTLAEAQKKAPNYQSQLMMYRQATALLLGLPVEYITAHLLFTRIPVLI